jgi:y4mF family transcriptional regulator
LYPNGYKMTDITFLAAFIKDLRKRLSVTQEELAERAGVGLRFIRDVEQGKTTLRMDKVNQVLALAGYSLVPSREVDPYDIHRNHFNQQVKIYLTNRHVVYGFITAEIREGAEIKGWKFVPNNQAREYQQTKNESLTITILNRDIAHIENI